MKTTPNVQRLALALIGAATIIGASGCGTNGGAAAPAPASTASQPASMDAGMSGSAMASSMATPGGGPSASPGMGADLTIHIKSFVYSGADNVPAGATISVMNMDNEAHTVTADDGSFNVVVKPGTSATFSAPAKAGTYTYHCTYHASMHGTLTVK